VKNLLYIKDEKNKKHFGGVEALKGVNFEFWQGEIVSLIGDNGAGKPTLIKIICGVHEPDEGEIILDGEKVKLSSPQQARNMGIETIYQNLALFDVLDITTNLFAGRKITKGSFLLNKKKMDNCLKMLWIKQEFLLNHGNLWATLWWAEACSGYSYSSICKRNTKSHFNG